MMNDEVNFSHYCCGWNNNREKWRFRAPKKQHDDGVDERDEASADICKMNCISNKPESSLGIAAAAVQTTRKFDHHQDCKIN